MPTDDELAQTATAPAGGEHAQTATAPATPSALAAPPRATLGRYRLQAVLGQGGMGVVHAAFDPELERKVALKVLRSAGSDDARARLLREARALAKLSHPHVITVFDVGSVDGQDFIAMELVDGKTLGDWLRDEQPRRRQIVAAFIAAGRGLAAAHAEGLVHRDFKPSNVLCSRTGKILVTDFGLARAAGGDGAAAAHASSGSVTTTRTGAILGTPAYMAPEQWSGGTVTPATDQFAFCIALWEALAGERPFRGKTMEELRTGVLGGPAELAADAIPRPLRAILRRGLAVEPAQRWPSMDTLLAALDGYQHRRRRWLIAGGLVAAASGIALTVVATRPAVVASSDCAPPALDPAVAWSPLRAGFLAGRDAGAARLVGSDVDGWRALRAKVCALPPVQRAAKLVCLDATLARLDAVVMSALGDTARIDADSLASALVDPAMCDRPSPPRLTPITPELVAALTLRRHAQVGQPPASAAELALADRATTPCARTVALTARIENLDERNITANAGSMFRDVTAIADVAARCDDDPIKTESAIGQANFKGNAAMEVAQAALATFPQSDLRAIVEAMRAQRAIAAKRWADADKAFASALDLLAQRHRVRSQIHTVQSQIAGLLARGRGEDLSRAEQLFATWLPIARGLGPKLAVLDEAHLRLRWQLGDVAAADRDAEALHARGLLGDVTPPYPIGPGIDVTGEVVDADGKPVADAEVDSAPILVGDGARVTSPLHAILRTSTRTGRDGTFKLAGVHGPVIAQAGDARSLGVKPASHVHLVVRPTSVLEGHVDLAGTPAGHLWVVATRASTGGDSVLDGSMLVAPILPDGSFKLAGAPRDTLTIGVAPVRTYEVGSKAQRIVVTGAHHTGIALVVSQRALHIIGRTADITPPDGALFWLFGKFDPGPHPTLRTLKVHAIKSGLYAPAANLEHLPKELAGKVRADDLLVTVPDRPDGALVACGLPFAKQQFTGTTSLEDFGKKMADLELACAQVPANQQVVTVNLPPVRRLSE